MESINAPLINKVAQSGLITINLEDFFPVHEMAHFDLKDHLFMGMILKEKDFRETISNWDWEQYQDKVLLVYCSADAIIPTWAYMLVAIKASKYAIRVFQGTEQEFIKEYMYNRISELNPDDFKEARVVIKGCGDLPVPASAYIDITTKLQPVVQSLMYGEPCSTVPLFKRPRTQATNPEE
jgi:hypothetical protein